jgi:hypothetical protein
VSGIINIFLYFYFLGGFFFVFVFVFVGTRQERLRAHDFAVLGIQAFLDFLDGTISLLYDGLSECGSCLLCFTCLFGTVYAG